MSFLVLYFVLGHESCAGDISRVGPQIRLATILHILLTLGASFVLVALLMHQQAVVSEPVSLLVIVTLLLLLVGLHPIVFQIFPHLHHSREPLCSVHSKSLLNFVNVLLNLISAKIWKIPFTLLEVSQCSRRLSPALSADSGGPPAYAARSLLCCTCADRVPCASWTPICHSWHRTVQTPPSPATPWANREACS